MFDKQVCLDDIVRHGHQMSKMIGSNDTPPQHAASSIACGHQNVVFRSLMKAHVISQASKQIWILQTNCLSKVSHIAPAYFPSTMNSKPLFRASLICKFKIVSFLSFLIIKIEIMSWAQLCHLIDTNSLIHPAGTHADPNPERLGAKQAFNPELRWPD